MCMYGIVWMADYRPYSFLKIGALSTISPFTDGDFGIGDFDRIPSEDGFPTCVLAFSTNKSQYS